MFEMQARMLLANESTPRILRDLKRFVMPWSSHGMTEEWRRKKGFSIGTQACGVPSPLLRHRPEGSQHEHSGGRGEGLIWCALGVDHADEGGKGEGAVCGDPVEFGPEIGLKRQTGAVPLEAEGALDEGHA
ncbi:hypothetical protein ADZ37_17820 [Pannonibacter phragmitetus]|nr:hypothetical protein ADZ37_17820 [Pannonibacter phragmitetus]